tara:strand:- start:2623 stop:3036 length:414 start_codon:yes stop_codon:yes gene_type:complete
VPLVGGGGAPNVSGGSNPAGTGSSLNYIGQHAYMYTGGVSCSTSETTIAQFGTGGNTYLVGSWQPQLMENTTDDIQFKLYINDQVIAQIVLTSSKDYSPFEEVEVIIPGDTIIKITGQNLGSGSKDCGSIITGRVYA